MRRYDFLAGAAAFSGALLPMHALRADAAEDPFAQIERATGGRLGVFAYDTESGRTMAHRAHERFAMCSTFKFLAVSAVLARVDAGTEHLDRRVHYGEADLLEYAPVTRAHVREGAMTVRALCEAAIEYSDNTAANLLLGALGGPHAVTAYARSLGDAFTRLDRTEPALNSAIAGDPRDTTTPAAMAGDMRAVLAGNALQPRSRALLRTWLVNCRTGTASLRAGMPHTWTVGDKTGTGGPHNAHGESSIHNDIAIAWPPARRPLIVTAYLSGAQVPAPESLAALARAGEAVSRLWFSRISFRDTR
jgi:beta-lactamase class A